MTILIDFIFLLTQIANIVGFFLWLLISDYPRRHRWVSLVLAFTFLAEFHMRLNHFVFHAECYAGVLGIAFSTLTIRCLLLFIGYYLYQYHLRGTAWEL